MTPPNVSEKDLHVVPMLRSFEGQAGGNGVYLGVGADQNLSYIAHLRPALAILIDIRRDNLLLQLLFRRWSRTRPREAAAWTPADGPQRARRDTRPSIESLVRLIDQGTPNQSSGVEIPADVRERLAPARIADDRNQSIARLNVFHELEVVIVRQETPPHVLAVDPEEQVSIGRVVVLR